MDNNTRRRQSKSGHRRRGKRTRELNEMQQTFFHSEAPSSSNDQSTSTATHQSTLRYGTLSAARAFTREPAAKKAMIRRPHARGPYGMHGPPLNAEEDCEASSSRPMPATVTRTHHGRIEVESTDDDDLKDADEYAAENEIAGNEAIANNGFVEGALESEEENNRYEENNSAGASESDSREGEHSGYETDEEVENITTYADEIEDENERKEIEDSRDPSYIPILDALLPEPLQPDLEPNDFYECTDGGGVHGDASHPLEAPATNTASPTSPSSTVNNGPRDGESISCPPWGHPLLKLRQDVEQQDVRKRSAMYREVARFFSPGNMRGEQAREEDENTQGRLRKHRRVDDSEPPELCASESDEETDTSGATKVPSAAPCAFSDKPTLTKKNKGIPTGKALCSIAPLCGPHPITINQFEVFHHLWNAVTSAQLADIRRVIDEMPLRSSATGEGTADAKYKKFEECIKSKVPLFSVSRARTLKTECMVNYQIPMFRVKCENEDDEDDKACLTQAALYSDIIAADVLLPGVGQAILDPKVCKTPGVLPHYFDTDHGRDTAACQRPGAYGVAADDCDGEAAEYGKTDIDRVYTNNLFCQDSIVRLSLARAIITNDTHNRNIFHSVTKEPVEYDRVRQKQLVVKPKGEPFIVKSSLKAEEMNKDATSEDVLKLQTLARPGAVCWKAEICDDPRYKVSQVLSRDGTNLGSVQGQDILKERTASFNTYLCFNLDVKSENTKRNKARSTRGPLPSSSESEDSSGQSEPELQMPASMLGYNRSLIFIAKDSSNAPFPDCEINLTGITVLSTPSYWEKGTLRPVENKPYPNPYTTKLRDKDNDGIPITTIPIRPFMDDCALSADGKKTGGGLYFDYMSMGQRVRSAIQSVRINGFVTDKTETDALILAMAYDLVELSTKGMIMNTVLGLRRIYVVITNLCGDYVQCAKSSHATGHASNAPCGGCTWRRGPEGAARYTAPDGISNLNHFMNMERCEAVMEQELKPGHFRYMGIRQNALIDIDAFHRERVKGVEAFDTARSKKAPLHALRILRECCPTIARYCPFLSCWPGPDHLLFLGLGKGVLNLTFSTLCAADRRKLASYFKKAIAEAGLPEPYGLLRKNQSVKEGYLASLSVAQIASCIMVAPVALSKFNSEIYATGLTTKKQESMTDLKHAKRLLILLRQIMNVIYFSPKTCSDTKDAADRRQKTASQLGDLCVLYMREVEVMASSSQYSRGINVRVKQFCDLPNLHRLFELCTYWLPCVGYNVSHLAEILFEKCHQVIKHYYGNVPAHEVGGYFCMLRLEIDNAMKRTRIGSSNLVPPRGSVFDCNVEEDIWRIFDKVAPFFSPGHRGQVSPLAALMEVRTGYDRIWMKRGMFKDFTIDDDVMMSMCDEMRIPRACTLTKVPAAKFGLARESHNVISPGCVISAITDSRMKATMRSNEMNVFGHTDRRLRLRSVPLSELDADQDFGTHQVMIAVHEVWQCEQPTDGNVRRLCIFAKGYLLESMGERSKEDLLIFRRTDKVCWVKLDRSCKKVMSFGWKPLRAGESTRLCIGTAKFSMSHTKFSKCKYFVVADHEEGFPSRAG